MTWLKRVNAIFRFGFALMFLAQGEAAQQGDGRIVFRAGEAKVRRDGEEQGVAGGADRGVLRWTRASDSFSWEYKPTRWGMYDLELVHLARTANGPIEVRVEIAGQVFPVEVHRSPPGDRFQTSRIARVYLPKADPFTVVLRTTKLGEGAALEIREVVLAPAPEGAPMVQEGSRIALPSSNAITHSVMMRYEPATNKNCLGYWTNPKDSAEWRFSVGRPGTYEVELWQGCGKGQGGSDVAVVVSGKKGVLKEFRFVVEDTGHFQNFIPRKLGELNIPEAGEYSLFVQPQRKQAAAVMDIRQIVLARSNSSAAAPNDSPEAATLRLARFDIDATPPIGSHMAYDPVTNQWDLGLRARGVVLLGADAPIVLCAVDWIGIANEGYDAFRQSLAEAAGTSSNRVAVHALHQHDAPDCDFSAERILKDVGMDPRQFESSYQRLILSNLSTAVRRSLPKAQAITHLGLGEASVEKVASNRRIFGPEGKVRAVRYTACPDEALRNEPEGTIDPVVSLVSFWNGEKPLAVLSYYATHPQSYYRTGIPNPDFPGLARFTRQLAVPAALHVHFTGAGGNIGAGKYNDGAQTNRLALAERLADGMRRAWENTKREPLEPLQIGWSIERVTLPPSKHLSLESLEAEVANRDPKLTAQGNASRLAWLRRCLAGHRLEISSLKLGRARILHLPGELFVEYQLAAKAERPDLFVAMAAYGDYAPWYIGTAAAYEEGGYETEPRSSNVAPEVESVLRAAIQKLLKE